MIDYSNFHVPFGPVGRLTARRTYCRPIPEYPGLVEDWEDVVDRQLDGIETQLDLKLSEDEKELFKDYHMNLEGSVAGRFLWQLGTTTVDRLGLSSLQNCAGVLIDHPIKPFTWAMDMLALGVGVGFNIQSKYVNKLPAVKSWFKPPKRTSDRGANFLVPDSREGWVELLEKTLEAAFTSENFQEGTFTYNTDFIRKEGEPIKGFGGTASGPEYLVQSINQIAEILWVMRGKKLKPIHCLDIMCLIAQAIIAGNVRRSALISIGDSDDYEYIKAKRWDLQPVPNYRRNANLSVACEEIEELPELFWEGYTGNSECIGLVNFRLSRMIGRTVPSGLAYEDPNIVVYNPCAEQGLNNFETCCLSEQFLPRIHNYKRFLDILTISYKVNKHSLMLFCHQPDTEAIVRENMRMGISISGLCQANQKQLGFLDPAYHYLRELDEVYSKEIGTPTSIKLTTFQPSGTKSLLPGITPGVNSAFAEYMIRRIRVDSKSKLLEAARLAGYPTEPQRRLDGSIDPTTSVISLPFAYEGAITSETDTAIKQMERVMWAQRNWSDNSVSTTIYYTPEELPGIRDFLEKNYKDGIKTISFMLREEHGFDQAPYEKITKEQYEEMKNVEGNFEEALMEIDIEELDAIEIFRNCEGNACPVR